MGERFLFLADEFQWDLTNNLKETRLRRSYLGASPGGCKRLFTCQTVSGVHSVFYSAGTAALCPGIKRPSCVSKHISM